MILFLDFDGVLRRASSPLYVFDTDCLEVFEEAVRTLQGVEIVVSSSWREGFSLKEIRSHFSRDIAARIVGATPISEDRDGFYRYREVLAYLERNRLRGRTWLAIDDDPLHYPAGVNVLLVDPVRGFDSEAATRLVASCLNA